MQRFDIINQFINNCGFIDFNRELIAGDASFRKYERVATKDKNFILMDAPPDKEDIKPFIKVANYLKKDGLSTPDIIASDTENGLMLLEDLGDDLFAHILNSLPEKETELYLAAADVLVKLYKKFPANNYDLPLFSKDKMLSQVELLLDWYIPLCFNKKADEKISKEYLEIWSDIIDKIPNLQQVMVLYDFHAENMIWLENRHQEKRVGLLDFQDAMIGNPAYDMVSFLEDARRDVSKETVNKVKEFYIENTKINAVDFELSYAIMSSQRNCRIVGTFARLKLRDNKPRYLSFMDRVLQHLSNDVSHPVLLPLKKWLNDNINLK